MKMEILGSGCSKCKKTEEKVRKIVANLGIDAEISKVEDINEIIDRGVMLTPTIAVDGEIKITGRIPSDDEIENILT